jgi:hypothetical protein
MFAERMSIKVEPRIHARTELKVNHFLNHQRGRLSINTVVPMPMIDMDHDIVLGLTMSLSGLHDVFGLIQDDWNEPQKMAQKLDLCFDRFRHSIEYFKTSSNQAETVVSLQHAVACAAFQDIMNDSLAFHETAVKITLVEARDLMSMDSNGFSDPYCKVIMRHLSTGDKIFGSYDTTAIVNKSLNPRWNWSNEYILKSAALVEFRVKDHDDGMRDDFIGCASIDLSDIRTEAVGTIKDIWLTLCDDPSKDIKHKGLRLLSLTPNITRGKVSTIFLHFSHPFNFILQIHVLVERTDASKSGATGATAGLSTEAVKLAVKECPSLRLQQRSLETLLDSGNEMAKYLIMCRALMSEKYDKLSQQHHFLQVKHEEFVER